MRDIDYFNESDLDYKNIEYFYESLPSHLKRQFKNSTAARIVKGNVLQGYRGPDYMCNGGSGDSSAIGPTNGVQEICYWWSARKDINFIPVIGTIVYTGVRLAQSGLDETKWGSLFFDTKTGECLSHSKNEAADKLNDKGLQLFNEEYYSEAAEYFDNAYKLCSGGYTNEQTFKDNRENANNELDAINLNNQGDDLFNKGRYSKARDKYQEAYDKSNNKSSYRTYNENRDKAQNELDAINLNNQGNNLFSQGRYSEARAKYQEAYNKSQVSYHTYAENRDKAQVEVDAEDLNNQGNYFYNQGSFREAKDKYQEAYNQSEAAYEIYQENRNKAQIEIDAEGLNNQGDQLLKQDRFSEARAKYQTAYNTSEANKNKYANNYHQAQAEIDAESLCGQGDYLFSKEKYTEAQVKYQEAYNKSQFNRDKYITKYNRAQEKQVEVSAEFLNNQGNQLFNQGSYKEARAKYQEAYNKFANQTYNDNINRAQAEVDAVNLNSQGDSLFEKGKYTDANDKYQEAYNKSEVAYHIYEVNINKAQAEIDAEGLNNQGDQLLKQDRFSEARAKYQTAYNTSEGNKTKYAKNYHLAQAEIDAESLCGQGHNLFSQGRYKEAEAKYYEAYSKSKNKDKYRGNIKKAQEQQAEVEAESFNKQANDLLKQGKYEEALSTFKKAQDKSKVNKIKYEENVQKAQAEVSADNLNYHGDNYFDEKSYKNAVYYYNLAQEKSQISSHGSIFTKNIEKVEKELVSLIETLWNNAWDAENDIIADRSEEAQRLFKQAQEKSKEYSQILPKTQKFKRYEVIASLKIEGNVLCNQGLELQQSGLHLLEEAQLLNQRGHYQLAGAKFKEAESKFLAAQKKFQRGCQSDHRFVACVEFVKEQIEEIREAIELTNNQTLSEGVRGLNIRIADNSQEEIDISDQRTVNYQRNI